MASYNPHIAPITADFFYELLQPGRIVCAKRLLVIAGDIYGKYRKT